MTNIKRFDLNPFDGECGMVEDASGNYVTWDDYLALQNSYDAYVGLLRGAIEAHLHDDLHTGPSAALIDALYPSGWHAKDTAAGNGWNLGPNEEGFWWYTSSTQPPYLYEIERCPDTHRFYCAFKKGYPGTWCDEISGMWKLLDAPLPPRNFRRLME